MDGVDDLRVISEGLWCGALGITELVEDRGAGLVDSHQQPVQPHNWSRVHPVLDVPHQTGGIGETGEAGADQRGAVHCKNGRVKTTQVRLLQLQPPILLS